jgi:hypothetical protein
MTSEPSAYDALHAITDQLLFENDNTKLTLAAQQLYDLFLNVSGALTKDNDTQLPTGTALSAYDAAQCILDVNRTSKFLQGIHAALIKAQEQFPNETLEVVYAGCGPFATLIVPLARRFNPTRVRFTLIDTHRDSLDSARRIAEVFGLQGYIRSYQQTDASNYAHNLPIHVLVVETMQRALTAEPQVAVTLNLTRQLCREGILVPEEIYVDLGTVDLRREFDSTDRSSKVRIDFGPVLRLSRESAFKTDSDHSFLVCVKELTPFQKGLTPALFTKIRIFDTIELGDYESGLTFIHPLHDLSLSESSNRLEFTYRLGPKPGFTYRWI